MATLWLWKYRYYRCTRCRRKFRVLIGANGPSHGAGCLRTALPWAVGAVPPATPIGAV